MARKPGDFGIQESCLASYLFSGFEDKALRKMPFRQRQFFPEPYAVTVSAPCLPGPEPFAVKASFLRERSMFMLKKKLWLKPAALMLPILLAAALLTGCPQPSDPEPDSLLIPANLDGYFQSLPWAPAYAFYDDGFVVDASANTFYYYGDSTFSGKWGGPIVKIVPDGEAFIMIVEIAQVIGEWFSPPETGKYFAVAYKNLTESAVNSSAAYNADGNNTGTATIAEAESEYTIANGYFNSLDTTLYYPHAASAETLASLQGDWHWDDDDYYIQIKGTKLAEWMDDGDGVYDAGDDAYMLGELGDIVDHTDTSRAAGVLYVRIIASDILFTVDKYIAIAWKDKTSSSVSFATGTTDYDTLAEVKAACNDPDNTDQFPANSFYDYIK
jgi:hypothetical protein